MVSRTAHAGADKRHQDFAQVRNRQTGQTVPALVFFFGINLAKPEEKLHDRCHPRETIKNCGNPRGETLRRDGSGRIMPESANVMRLPHQPDMPEFRPVGMLHASLTDHSLLIRSAEFL
jgi:hypothetical protein